MTSTPLREASSTEGAIARSKKFITAVDPVELAVRLVEAANEVKRPPGSTAMQAFLSMETESRETWMRAAHAALLYWRECIADLKPTN